MSEQAFLALYDSRTGLTEAERHDYIKVRHHGLGVRELARRTDRSPGTVGNLLSRAEEKLQRVHGGSESYSDTGFTRPEADA